MWFRIHEWFFGNVIAQGIASCVYLVVALAPLVWFASRRYDNFQVVAFAKSWYGLTWALFVSLGYPVWSLLEAWVFEKWVEQQAESVRDDKRRYFALMADRAKGFWTAVLATYTIAGLWALALRA